MRKFTLLSTLLLFCVVGFSQQEENGTIYIKHPNIDAVNKTTEAYLSKDWNAEKILYSDTAKWWSSGLKTPIPIADAIKSWATDYDYYDSVKIEKRGYPDYLHYKDQDGKTVQSWWVMSGVSKKTGKKTSVYFVQFDDFNNDGKIVFESIFGDFSKWQKE
jgi:hypothetical protein